MRRRSELVVALLLMASAACAIAFVVFYAIESLGRNTQYLGLALGGSLAFLAAPLILTGDQLVKTENPEGDNPPADEEGQGQADEPWAAPAPPSPANGPSGAPPGVRGPPLAARPALPP